MKKAILLGSIGVGLLATLTAIYGTVSADPQLVSSGVTSMKSLAVAFYLGLLSFTTFFVGVVFPKE
jgi:hypothetical protein